MITPAYSPTATERVLPRLALDFTTAVLDPRVTVARALNTATRVNSSGNIEIVNANLPRFDYDPVTLASKGLLIEETRTNLVLGSNDFTNGSLWAVNGTPTILANQEVSPDGTTNAATFDVVGASNGFGVYTTYAIAAGTYTATLFFKRISGNIVVRLGFGVNSSRVDITTLAVINGTNSVGTVTPWKDGYYRFTVVVTTASAQSLNIYSIGSNTGKMAIYGCQVEAGSFATSYIPTTSGAVTRNADVVTMTGANFSGWYSSGSGAFQIAALPRTISGTRPIIQADDASADNIIALRQNNADPELYIVSSATPQAQIDAGTVVAGTAYKLAGTWATDNCAAAKDGAAAVTDTSATIPTPTQLRIGSDGTNYGNMWVSKINYWPQRVTNAETQAFSK